MRGSSCYCQSQWAERGYCRFSGLSSPSPSSGFGPRPGTDLGIETDAQRRPRSLEMLEAFIASWAMSLEER